MVCKMFIIEHGEPFSYGSYEDICYMISEIIESVSNIILNDKIINHAPIPHPFSGN